jgi:hypothetical protein
MEFLKGAKDFARNPLGIVALFISLIYGFASLLLNSSAEKLTVAERWPLVIFIVIFPIMVLFAFYKLVTKHHGKPYAPGDFKDDKSFLRTLSQEEQERRLEKELRESFEQTQNSSVVNLSDAVEQSSNSQDRRERKMEEYRKFRQELESIEKNVIERIAEEHNTKVEKNVGIDGTDVSFQALLLSGGDWTTFIEVKVLRSPALAMMMIDRLLYRAVVAEKFFESRFKLILVIVYYFEDNELERVEKFWRKKVKNCPANIELRFMAKNDVVLTGLSTSR